MIDAKKIAAALAIVTGLSAGGLEIEQSNQISDINSKAGVNSAMVMATISLSESHCQDVEDALVTLYEEDGYVDYDNLELHQAIINNHFNVLKSNENLPDWYYNKDELTDNQIIANIHTSLKNH